MILHSRAHDRSWLARVALRASKECHLPFSALRTCCRCSGCPLAALGRQAAFASCRRPGRRLVLIGRRLLLRAGAALAGRTGRLARALVALLSGSGVLIGGLLLHILISRRLLPCAG